MKSITTLLVVTLLFSGCMGSVEDTNSDAEMPAVNSVEQASLALPPPQSGVPFIAASNGAPFNVWGQVSRVGAGAPLPGGVTTYVFPANTNNGNISNSIRATSANYLSCNNVSGYPNGLWCSNTSTPNQVWVACPTYLALNINQFQANSMWYNDALNRWDYGSYYFPTKYLAPFSWKYFTTLTGVYSVPIGGGYVQAACDYAASSFTITAQ